jgi:hypothetical protein
MSCPFDGNAPDWKREIRLVSGRVKHMERMLGMLISFYIDPPQEKCYFVKNILLNNAMLSLSAKPSLFRYISDKSGWARIGPQHFRRISSAETAILQNKGLSQKERECLMHDFSNSYVIVKERLELIIKDIMRKTGRKRIF